MWNYQDERLWSCRSEMKILLIEDDETISFGICSALGRKGYEVDGCSGMEEGKRIFSEEISLILLDLNLPETNGFQICRELKQKSTFPVLVLTSRDQMKDELHALDLGADEYLTKPCRKERLLARVSNLLRRYEGRANLLEGPGFLLDEQTYTLYIYDKSVILPKNQGKLLEMFLRHRDETVTREMLCDALWGTAEYIDENALQVNLTRLKKTMKNLGVGQRIEPVRGIGYRMMTDVEE